MRKEFMLVIVLISHPAPLIFSKEFIQFIFNPMNFGSVGEEKMSVRLGSCLFDKENLLIIEVSQ